MPLPRSGPAHLMMVFAMTAVAQGPGITHYSLEHGLPQSMVNHVLQDADGFIWLGTGDGLARFDGARFVNYKHDPRDSTSIADNSIWGIAEADEHHLWVGTRTGLDRLDRRTGRFEHARIGTRKGKNGCWYPVQVAHGRAVFHSDLTNELLSMRDGAHRRTDTRHHDCDILRATPDGTRLFAIAHPDSLFTTDIDGGDPTWRRIPLDPGDRVIDFIQVEGGWFLLTERTGWLMDTRGTRHELPAHLLARVSSTGARKYVQRAPDGLLWVALSKYGVIVLRPDLSIVRTYSLKDDNGVAPDLTTIRFDRQGNCWVGTDGAGVFKISPQRIKFARVGRGQQRAWEPPSWFVRGFAQWDEHRVLVSFHEGGLALFDERMDELVPFPLPGRDPQRMSARIMNDADGLVWSKDEQGLLAIDPRSGQVVFDPPDGRFMVTIPDSAGAMQLAQWKACATYRFVDGRMVTGPARSHPMLDSMVGNYERAIVDPRGHWWTTAHEVPVSVWGNGGRLGIEGAQPSPSMRMLELVPSGNDRAWMTTNDGLLLWSLDPPRILEHYTIHEGLPDQFTYGIVDGGDGAWWISTNNGIARFDAATARFRSYSTVHGIQSLEFNTGAFFRSRSGRIYFGGVEGFNHFLPAAVKDDPDQALVRMVRVDNGTVPLDALAGATVDLAYPRNELNVMCAVLEFTAPEDNFLGWRLRGYDDEWRTMPATEAIGLSNVPDGVYTLEAFGINGDGVKGAPLTLLQVVVRKPLWARTWLIVLTCTLAIGALAFAWVRVSKRRMQRKLADAEREMKELRLRTRLAKDIHDDVGSGLARMAALSRSSKRESDAAQRFDKVAGISGELLDNLRDVVWMNDPRQDTRDALLLRMHEHANDLFEESRAAVRAHFPDPSPARMVDGIFRRNLYLIAKEALHNAHKYSGARNITLRWEERGGEFTLEIADDGMGVTRAGPQGTGHGTENMRQRAAEIGARYERVQTAGGGTTVRVQGRS